MFGTVGTVHTVHKVLYVRVLYCALQYVSAPNSKVPTGPNLELPLGEIDHFV